MNFFESLLGPNYRTTLSGLTTTFCLVIAALAVLPSDTWTSPKVYIPAILGIIAKTLKDIQTKDAVVSGNGTVEDPARKPDPTNPAQSRIVNVLIACVGISALALLGCATNTGNPSKDRAGRVTNAVLSNLAGDAGHLALGALESAVMSASSGNDTGRDLEQAAATGAWTSAGSINVASDVENLINAWNGGTAPAVAKAAAQVYTAANPQTQAQCNAVMNVIAGTISGAATAAP